MFSALSFSAPLVLAALAALPIIWLLLRATPPSPKQARFPAFIILRQLSTTEETPDRTPWWLLLLRLLLTALIIVGLAGPILNAPTPTPTSGPLVLVVDDSWAAAQAWRPRLDAIREAASEADQNNRPLYIATTSPTNTPIALDPLTPDQARAFADALIPTPFKADRPAIAARLDALSSDIGSGEIRWLSDNLEGKDDLAFARTLSEQGDLTIYADSAPSTRILRAIGQKPEGPVFRVERINVNDEIETALVAIASDGRELAREPVVMKSGEPFVDVSLFLPLALRNELAIIRLENARSAGEIYLVDARERRALIGLVADADRGRSNLLSGAHYVRQALNPYAEFIADSLDGILTSDASVIILDDVGRLRRSEIDALTQWVERGGVLIRFAGPVLAETAQDEEPPLLPVKLRGGGRAFGGALTWDTPQALSAFSINGPFATLAAPKDVYVKRQVLAEPGGATTEKTWARLEDGTPLVTGERVGAGVIALFHVTATPEWSDIPISGVFVDMLRRLSFLSTLGPDNADETAGARFAPIRLLDGLGRLRRPGDEDAPLNAEELSMPPNATRQPGLYGAPDAPLALNAVSSETEFAPLNISGFAKTPYTPEPPVDLSAPLFVAALALLLLDGLITLLLSGKLNIRMVAALLAIFVLPGAIAPKAIAQPLDAPIEQKPAEAALATRLAYVETGDPATDRLSGQAMAALSRELVRRTAIEPGPPQIVNLDTDDLSVYPFLYWPIIPDAEPPSDEALVNIENFMRFGGLILIDTRDDERAVTPGSTPESQALQRVLSQLNIPPLTPVESGHVLTRSFYLMEPLPVKDLPGRVNINPVWVQADATGANDGVTPLIIGGRDWAGAWAADSFGRPVMPMGRGGERARELAYRAGVNIIMVAFTGNYKSDQVHAPILLERLGE